MYLISSGFLKQVVLTMMTATARKTSLENKHLRNCDYFAIISSTMVIDEENYVV